MKLRVKYKTTRSTIDVEGEFTLHDVREQVKEIPNQQTSWFLSLNGVDKIEAPVDATLDSLDVVGGDLIHIVESSIVKDDSHNLEERLLKMGFTKANIEKVTRSFGATNLNDALELLNMLDNPNPTKTIETKKELNKREKSSSGKAVESGIEKMQTVSPATSAILAHGHSTKQDIKPLFLSEGVTDSFASLVNQVKCETAPDYLCLVIHSLMLETGLRSQAATHSNAKTTSQEQNERHLVSNLPENWRNPEMGFYRFNYVYKSHQADICCLTGTVTGNSIVVSGTLDRDDSDVVYQTKLNITDFVDKSAINTGKASEILKNLNRLSHKIKESVANKLLDEIRIKFGLTYDVIGIQTLPEELKLRLICCYLPVQSVCRLSQTAREWRDFCTEEVWKRLMFREFHCTDLSGASYKDAFKTMYRVRIEDQKRQRQPRTPMRPEFEVPDDHLYQGVHQPMVPGIIGGRQDLFPSGGFMPGGFPAAPGLDILRERQPPNLRRPPGARFDPYGPIPDDDDFHPPGRRYNHPGTLHRPGFGPGNGFGGGFGFM